MTPNNYTPISIQALTQTTPLPTSTQPDGIQAMFDAKGTSKSEPAMISSSQGSNIVSKTNEQLQTLKGDPDENAKLLADAQKRLEAMKVTVDERAVSESADKMTFINPETGQETTLSGPAITDKAKADLKAQGFEVSEANLSTRAEPTPLEKAKSDRAKAEQELSGFLTQLNQTAISSKELRQTIRRIEGVYGERIQAMQNINERRYKQLNTLGVRLGSRYSGGSGGVIGSILTEEERQGAARIAAIEAEMEAAINGAEKEAREFNFSLYTQQVERAQEKYDEKVKAFQELEEAQQKAEQEIKDEAQLVEHQSNIIEQIELGKTDPVAIFSALNGQVPFDIIKEMTESLPEADKPVTLGSADLLVNPVTGEVIARGSKVGGGGDTSLNVASNGGYLPVTEGGTGAPAIAGLGTSYNNSSPDAQFAIERIFNGLPTQLKNNVAEHPLWKNSILNYLKRGYDEQRIKDELSGFALFDKADKTLGYTFYNLSAGTDIEPEVLAGLINRGDNIQAMSEVEKAKLKDANFFFASMDDARTYTEAIKRAEAILKNPDFNKSFLGTWDGRQFKAERFLGRDATGRERILLQQLESQLAILNAPTRVSIAGTAATPEEMAKIDGFQAGIYDNPGTIEVKLQTLRDEILGFHNSARSNRNLPTVNIEQLTNNEKRLQLYKAMGNAEREVVESQLSNKDLFNSGSWNPKSSVPESTDVFNMIGL